MKAQEIAHSNTRSGIQVEGVIFLFDNRDLETVESL